ncbi:helix-turn-helix transcriptional regulator [Sphingomonas xinjiangensis]|uniref:DNA-binding transcriptional ArsR family regulator n=1 Tax=Sphingomonas xinjiangensis TaxID=643568 RepID=A0A840YRZ5_9SPHN|nr:DNA-binding transcriptional ArsR family regulator [Sphingomonas xinjiangensis]
MKGISHPALDDISLENVCQALTDPVRIEIVGRLAKMSEATCSVLNAGRPKSSMSHHYRVLRDSGLICTRTRGTTHFNALRRAELDARFPGLLDALLKAMAVDADGEAKYEASPRSSTIPI